MFGKFFSKFRISKLQGKSTNDNSLLPNQTIIENPLLKINDNFRTTEEINKALKNIEKSINNDGRTNKLILRKADLLLRKGKFNQARQLLIKLQKDKKDPITSKKAKKLLSNISNLQQQAAIAKNNILTDKLFLIAKKYNFQLKNIPDAQDPSFDLNISLFIRKESQRARTVDLPVLSLELIDKAIESGQKSSWLTLGKALSLDMMGQQEEALIILEKLKKTNKGEKITQSINSAIKNAQKNTINYRRHTMNIYLAKHLKAIAQNQALDTNFIPEIETINAQTGIKSLIFKEALNNISDSPETSLTLLDAILDYVPKDGSALQLKGEAFVALKKNQQAIQTWSYLVRSKNEGIAQTASQSISKLLAKKAKRISFSQSPQKAITFYIKEHFKYHLIPSNTKSIKSILEQIQPQDEDFFDPELRQHQLQLQFNTLLIDYLEAQLSERDRLEAGAAAQNPGAISKTA